MIIYFNSLTFVFIILCTLTLVHQILATGETSAQHALDKPHYDQINFVETYDSQDYVSIPEADAEAALKNMLNQAGDRAKSSHNGEINGIWFKVRKNHVHWLAHLLKHEFNYQLAVDPALKMGTELDNVILMKRWFKGQPPLAAFTTVGVAAVVVGPQGHILLQEKTVYDNGRSGRNVKGVSYYFPNRALLPGETFDKALERILEEVGVEGATLHGMLELNYMHNRINPIRGRADMAIYFILSVPKETVKEGKSGVFKQRQEVEKMELAAKDKSALFAAEGWLEKWKHHSKHKMPKLFNQWGGYILYRTEREWTKIIEPGK